jgi:hypothetical protein
MRVLMHEDGSPVQVGDTVISFRNEEAIVTAMREPAHAGSTGRVYVRWLAAVNPNAEHGLYPSVFGLKWSS